METLTLGTTLSLTFRLGHILQSGLSRLRSSFGCVNEAPSGNAAARRGHEEHFNGDAAGRQRIREDMVPSITERMPVCQID
jgi:hypothetical protein